MKIAVVGTGYVGLVTGTCFADSGNDVVCIDINEDKIRRLNEGIIPIYEPGLTELVERNAESGRLTFTTSLTDGVKDAAFIFLAVGTPPADDGSADLTALFAVTKDLIGKMEDDAIVVVKSTVPVGTNAKVYAMLKEGCGKHVFTASNPEFLKEGAAINDFMYPDRVVVGVRDEVVGERLHELYAPFLRTDKPFLSMGVESAEMTKYVANAMLSTKISFINEMANLCEHLDADINDVRRGIGHDRRIGFQFLFPGVGYGGSCFPKDVRALSHLAQQNGVQPQILDAVDAVNNLQKHVLGNKVESHFGADLKGKKFAVWGLAFKPKTDDIREAPALVLIDRLLKCGAEVSVHDPEAMENVEAELGDKITYCKNMMDTVKDANALAINTEWSEFRHPDFKKMKTAMKEAVIFDGRNLYEPEQMEKEGFTYYSIGRATVKAK